MWVGLLGASMLIDLAYFAIARHELMGRIVIKATPLTGAGADGKSQDMSSKAHEAAWTDAGKHVPENLGDIPMDVIVIEVKK